MTNRETTIEAAKTWLEENTGFRWVTEPDPNLNVSVSSLNRPMRMRAKQLADFHLSQKEADHENPQK